MNNPQASEMILEWLSKGDQELSREQQEFIDWLEREMAARNWRPFELANAAGVYQSTLGKILNGERKVGPELAVKLAKALDLPPESVFRKAGLLPRTPGINLDQDLTLQELLAITRQMTADERREVLEYALFRFRKQKK
jgi:transcriptional regulator with XRE-family HTH domain